MDAAPYADFSTSVPHAKRAAQLLRFAAYASVGQGEYAHHMLPGPNCWDIWL